MQFPTIGAIEVRLHSVTVSVRVIVAVLESLVIERFFGVNCYWIHTL